MALLNTLGFLKDKFNLGKLRKLYYFEGGKKKTIDIGAYQEQKFNLSNTITDNPVEFGANLADSIYKNPDRIQVAIIVGDTTGLVSSVVNSVKNIGTSLSDGIIAGLQDSVVDFIDGNATGNFRSSKVFNEVIKIKENFLSTELVTNDRIYSNLQIESIERVINVENYGGAVIIVNLKSLLVFGTDSSNSLLDVKKKNGFMNLVSIASNLLEGFN